MLLLGGILYTDQKFSLLKLEIKNNAYTLNGEYDFLILTK